MDSHHATCKFHCLSNSHPVSPINGGGMPPWWGGFRADRLVELPPRHSWAGLVCSPVKWEHHKKDGAYPHRAVGEIGDRMFGNHPAGCCPRSSSQPVPGQTDIPVVRVLPPYLPRSPFMGTLGGALVAHDGVLGGPAAVAPRPGQDVCCPGGGSPRGLETHPPRSGHLPPFLLQWDWADSPR